MARRAKPWFWKQRRCWYVTIDGTRHNLGADRKRAWDRFHDLMRQPKGRQVASESVIALIDRFLEWTQGKRSPHTYEWYRYRLQRFAGRYPDLLVTELRPFHVEEWVDSYPSLSKTSRRNYIRSIKRCLRWSKQLGYIDLNPIAELEAPAADRRETFVPEDEYSHLLDEIPDDNFRDLVIVTWETGCRPQESLRVEGRHVELARKRWVFPTQDAKGKRRPRIVYLTDTALEITRRLLKLNPTGKLFRNSRGEPWTKNAANCAFDRVQARMGRSEMTRQEIDVTDDEIDGLVPLLKPTRRIKGLVVQKSEANLRNEARRKLRKRLAIRMVPRYSLYAIRHSWATRALRAGLDSLTVAILMGHSDPSTLARVYQHISHDPEHMLGQAQRVVGTDSN